MFCARSEGSDPVGAVSILRVPILLTLRTSVNAAVMVSLADEQHTAAGKGFETCEETATRSDQAVPPRFAAIR
jgi:hypothetical protein